MVLGPPPLAEGSLDEGRRDVRLLPYHRFEITSPMKREDAFAAIAAHVEAVKWFRFGWPSQSNDNRFEGEVAVDGFSIRRVMGYRNSFAPTVRGEIQSVGAMSRVIVTMRPFIAVLVFCAVWSVAVLGFLLTPGIGAWFGMLMLAALYLMVMGGFWFEASKQERVLRQIFQET